MAERPIELPPAQEGSSPVAQPFSEETQELLERAQRAIDRAVRLRGQTRRSLLEAKIKVFRLDVTVSQPAGIELKDVLALSRSLR